MKLDRDRNRDRNEKKYAGVVGRVLYPANGDRGSVGVAS